MKQLNQDMKDNNMFLVLEAYLAHPTTKIAKKIKVLSHALTLQAISEAEKQFPNKKIGADEYQPILMAIIQEQAETAFDFSTRLIQNDTVTDEDPPYIFKVSEKEERLIHTLKAIFLWGATNHSSPDGLIFSYNAFIERTDQSIYAYCNNLEQLFYKNNSLLHMKACDLQKRGDHQEATALLEICSEIKNLCNQNQASVGDKNTVYQINNILQQGSQRAEINNHKGLKEILVNCMISFSIIGLAYLAATTNQRDSFWYKTNTDRRNKIEYFSQDIQPLSGNPKI